MRLALLGLVLLAVARSTLAGFYLASDYYMDNKVSSTFKGVCGETINDDFAWFNSHINLWRTLKYGNNKDCWVRIDAGGRSTARTKFMVDWFNVQASSNSTYCSHDVLEFHDAYTVPPSGAGNRSFCAKSWNFTGLPSQRYSVLRWKTDGSGNDKGFRIASVRYETPNLTASLGNECRKSSTEGNYFFCSTEQICIDPRLKCDGTPHCEQNDDETGCTGVEKFLGAFLALGVEKNVTWIIGMIVGIIVIAVTIDCIKKHQQKKKEKNSVGAFKFA